MVRLLSILWGTTAAVCATAVCIAIVTPWYLQCNFRSHSQHNRGLHSLHALPLIAAHANANYAFNIVLMSSVAASCLPTSSTFGLAWIPLAASAGLPRPERQERVGKPLPIKHRLSIFPLTLFFLWTAGAAGLVDWRQLPQLQACPHHDHGSAATTPGPKGH